MCFVGPLSLSLDIPAEEHVREGTGGLGIRNIAHTDGAGEVMHGADAESDGLPLIDETRELS
jgi:hypothetical protein